MKIITIIEIELYFLGSRTQIHEVIILKIQTKGKFLNRESH